MLYYRLKYYYLSKKRKINKFIKIFFIFFLISGFFYEINNLDQKSFKASLFEENLNQCDNYTSENLNLIYSKDKNFELSSSQEILYNSNFFDKEENIITPKKIGESSIKIKDKTNYCLLKTYNIKVSPIRIDISNQEKNEINSLDLFTETSYSFNFLNNNNLINFNEDYFDWSLNSETNNIASVSKNTLFTNFAGRLSLSLKGKKDNNGVISNTVIVNIKDTNEIKSLKIEPITNKDLSVNDNLEFKATLTLKDDSFYIYQAGNNISPLFNNLTWSVSNENIAEITSGALLSTKKEGALTVKASLKDLEASYNLIISNKNYNFLDKNNNSIEELNLNINQTYELKLSNLKNNNIAWEIMKRDSSNPLINFEGIGEELFSSQKINPVIKANKSGKVIIQARIFNEDNTLITTKSLTIKIKDGLKINDNEDDFEINLLSQECYQLKSNIDTGITWDLSNLKGSFYQDNKCQNSLNLTNGEISNIKNIYYKAPKLNSNKANYDLIKAFYEEQSITITLKTSVPKISELLICTEDYNQETKDCSPDKVQVMLGDSLNLSLRAKLEDGQEITYQAGSWQKNILSSPTWSLSNPEYGEITATGLFTPKIQSEFTNNLSTSVYVQIGSDSEDNEEKTTYIAPQSSLNIEIIPAFTINGDGSSEQEYQVPALNKKTFKSNQELTWNFVNNQSGAKIEVSEDFKTLTYQAGIKSNLNDSSDIIDVFYNNQKIRLKIKVVPVVLENLSLNLEQSVLNIGDNIGLKLNYKLANDNTNYLINFNNETKNNGNKALLDKLNFSSSNSEVAEILNGIITAKSTGNTLISVESKLNSDLKSSVFLEVKAKKAEFLEDYTKVYPKFVSYDGILNIETSVYYEDGASEIEEVLIKFSENQLNSQKLKLQNIDNLNKTAHFKLTYPLPGNTRLINKEITYTIIARTKDSAEISKMGTFTIGDISNICTPKNKLLCLVRGLKCLREKTNNELSNECEQIILLFTDKTNEFSLAKIIQKYMELR